MLSTVHLALQGDLVEYNQCQSMLKGLYDLGIPGKEEEFTAYHILMLIHGRNRSGAFTRIMYCVFISDLPGRFKSLCRSTNPQTEIGPCCEACPSGTEGTLYWQLPLSF
jgi:hypothetical protein